MRQLSILPAVRRTAVVSEDQRYRYSLTRCWDDTKLDVAWLMLNPSTADADKDDATIRRCMGFAKRWGFGGIVVANIFGLRSTNPKMLKLAEDPIGPKNDEALVAAVAHQPLVICAWGIHGSLRDRGREVAQRLDDRGVTLHHLGLTAKGHPRHPLRLRRDLRPTRWVGMGSPFRERRR